MDVEVVGKFLSTLPEDDDHPYRTGPWRPQTSEWDADDLVAVEGEIPRDLDGVYLRNTENPLHPALKTYHPFDGDGMLHIVGFRDGKAFYRNRFVRTDGFLAENEAGEPLWPGLAEPVQLAKRDGGCGARTRMKDASSTDVIVHRGIALTSFYQCGDLYRVDPFSANTLGKESWNGHFPFDWGVSAHPKVDPKSGELLFFNYSKQAPYMHYGVVDESNELAHYIDIPLPGPRLPHDMAFTENYVILNDFPLFWDPSLLEHDVHLPRFYPDMPSRFAVVPRRGGSNDIRWFEADPTFVLHFTNAYEDGDEIVLDGFFEGAPQPLDTGGNKCGQAVSLPGAGSTAGPAAPVAVQPGHRRGQRRAIVGVHHRIRHDQPGLRRGQLSLRLRRHRQAGLVPVRRSGQARPAHRRRAALSVRRRGLWQ